MNTLGMVFAYSVTQPAFYSVCTSFKFKNKYRLFLFNNRLDFHSVRLHVLFLVLNNKKAFKRTFRSCFQAQLSDSEKPVLHFPLQKGLGDPLVLPPFHSHSSVMKQHEITLQNVKASPFSILQFFLALLLQRGQRPQ